MAITAGSFIPHTPLSLQTGGGTCEHPTAPLATPDVCKRASYRGVTGSKRREGANWVGGGIGVGGGNGDGNGVGVGVGNGNGDGDGDGAGAGTGAGAGVEANEGAHDGSGDGSGDGERTG